MMERARIEEQESEEQESLRLLRRDHTQIETAQKAGADQTSLDALARECDRFEAGIIAQAGEMIGSRRPPR
jgi:hypothetical protein